jgi:uncharacterized protein YbjT (DUF2867 family)
MKIVVIGGAGLIGSKTVTILRRGGQEVVAASRKGGVNTVTGEGLKEAIDGAQVVIDVSNAPSFDAKAVLEFFEISGRNVLAAEAAAGVRHHIALSIVGTDRVPGQSYYRAKVAQEKLIEASSIPYTIVRSTQFLEFLGSIADASADGSVLRVPLGLLQPIAADDVADVLAEVAYANPRNGANVYCVTWPLAPDVCDRRHREHSALDCRSGALGSFPARDPRRGKGAGMSAMATNRSWSETLQMSD